MTSGKSAWRLAFGAAVCVLICGIVSLAFQAKTSQYGVGQGRYLSQITKMSDSRVQQSPAWQPEPAISILPDLTIMPAWPPAPEPARPRLVCFLAAFHFRPPPQFL